ncbi:PKD domain-containing protein [Oceanihabitans sp. 2_MG-2023]|uniref:PKD domain-containing protein n=1 Tax=Oceanihabitans sp. 2_MG-2023 TaxID=3062661 RepID=UPI0026E42250|nr:PKD domain-containing protein [Oceanihabitans sp. 2_MG-2023]MDO6596566.1 PKD domain-containing protein [Oceanihabitans sp. 2_MG-2023]
MKNKVNIFRNSTLFLLSIVAASFTISCEDAFRDDLPDSNSQEDTILPTADFSYSADVDNFRLISFTDLSTQSAFYSWNFGNGDTSTDQDPTYTFDAEGTYPVTFTTSDANGASDSITLDVVVSEPEEPEAIVPVIGGWEFESSGDPLCEDSRDCWRISGASIHQTSSNGDGGTRSAKYTAGSADNRVSYQAITVSPNTSYVLRFRYSIRAIGSGDSIRASIVDGQLSNFSEFASATLLAQGSGTNALGVDNYDDYVLAFETGANGDIAIVFDHDGNTDNTWIDNVTIDVQ